MSSIDSIIFDLDGTLWSSVESVCDTWKKVLSKYPNVNKVLTVEDVKGCMGFQLKEASERLFPDLDEELQLKLINECCDAELGHLEKYGGTLFPKVEETLNILSQKYKLFIVSNCQNGYIQCFFKAHKLNTYFTDFECCGVTGLSKGENNKLIIKRNNLKNAVYVGDTVMDAESAKIANIPFVYARYGFGKVKEFDYVIDEFEDLLDLHI